MFRTFVAVAPLLMTGIAAADVTSGPDTGTVVAPLNVFAATGAHEGKELDIAAARKDKATVYLFIPNDKWDRPMARYHKTLDNALAGGNEKAEIVAVWLTDQQDQTKEYLPKMQQSLMMEATNLTVFAGRKAGPKDWRINDMAHLTAVVTVKEKVAATFAYQSLNETDVPALLKALRKSVGEK
jgi:hypothetical protein